MQLLRSDFDSFDEICEAAKLADAHDFIQKLNSGYSTEVGEKGANLSGGQRQRFGIARALYKDAPILILDEATASLDTHAERRILDALNLVAERRTTLAIAHRLSTIVHADNIAVIDQGEVVEQGTHAQLLARQGAYARLWADQQRESATA